VSVRLSSGKLKQAYIIGVGQLGKSVMSSSCQVGEGECDDGQLGERAGSDGGSKRSSGGRGQHFERCVLGNVEQDV
jgi:hypothetical protein